MLLDTIVECKAITLKVKPSESQALFIQFDPFVWLKDLSCTNSDDREQVKGSENDNKNDRERGWV